jgi:predicted component of type VI protein secretion system
VAVIGFIGRFLSLPNKHYRIGRSADDSDIVIEDPQRTVSSLHAELYQDELGRWYLIDRSRNGTFVYRNSNWMKLNHEAIAPGESISFGKQIVTVDWILRQIQHLLVKTGRPAGKAGPAKNKSGEIKPAGTPDTKPPQLQKPAVDPPSKGYIRDRETGKIRPRRSDE